MEHNVRRKDRVISEEQALELLRTCWYGVVGTVGEEGQPYGVPVHYVLHKGKIYFHCAKVGHKMDNIAHEPRVSFTVVGRTKPPIEETVEDFYSWFESVIVFGEAVVVEDPEEKWESLFALCEKYRPGQTERSRACTDKKVEHTCLVRIDMAQVTGKAKGYLHK